MAGLCLHNRIIPAIPKLQISTVMQRQQQTCLHTSCRTASILSLCLLKICLRTKSGPLNFLPLSGQRYLLSANFCVFTSIKRSTSVNIVKEYSVCEFIHVHT